MSDRRRKRSSAAASREKHHTLESSCSPNLEAKHEPKVEEEQKEVALFRVGRHRRSGRSCEEDLATSATPKNAAEHLGHHPTTTTKDMRKGELSTSRI